MWIVLSGSLTGAGSIESIGGRGYSNGYGTGAGGRISISSIDWSGFTGSALAATDGSGSSNAYEAGCGTVFWTDLSDSSTTLVLNADGHIPSDNRIGAGFSSSLSVTNLILEEGGGFRLDGSKTLFANSVTSDVSSHSIYLEDSSVFDATNIDNTTVHGWQATVLDSSELIFPSVSLSLVGRSWFTIGLGAKLSHDSSVSGVSLTLDDSRIYFQGREGLNVSGNLVLRDRSIFSYSKGGGLTTYVGGDLNVSGSSEIKIPSAGATSGSCYQHELIVMGSVNVESGSSIHSDEVGFLKGQGKDNNYTVIINT